MKRFELNHIKDKPPPFKVPEGYFEDLERSILAKTVEAPAEQEAKRTIGSAVPKWTWAVAASVIIGISALPLLNTGRTAFSDDDLLAGISDEEIMVYLANYDLNEYEIVGDLSIEQFDELFQEETILDGLDVDQGDLQDLMLEYEAIDETLEI